MARVSNPLIGSTSGSVGGITFSKWKGINVIKTKPTVVANPQSDGQTAQRTAFAAMVAAYRIMVSILVIGFKELAIKKSAFNAFVSVNIKNAFDFSAPPAATFLPENFLISKGTMSDTPLTSVAASIGGASIVFTFPVTNALPGQSATDRPLLAVYNATKLAWHSGIGAGNRATGTGSLDMPADWTIADSINCYLGFTNVAGDIASDSVYMPEDIVA